MTVASVINDRLNELGHGSASLLADLCEVSPSSVNHWRYGHRLPDPRKWHRIETLLGLTPGTIAAELAEEEA